MHRIILLILSLVASQCLFSQEIKGVVGRWPVVNITPEQARDKAIEEAKKEALRRAGIGETIKSSDVLSTIDNGSGNMQMFSSFSSIELQGAVTDYVVVQEDLEKNGTDGVLYATVAIDAKVKKYSSSSDPEFKINVSGLRSNGYKNGEVITFSVFPNKEGFLKVFLFENTTDASFIYPNDYELNRKFKAKETVNFPTVGIDYTAEKSTNEKIEHNLLLFVFTKKDIPFYGDTTYPRILNWVNDIEPNERDIIVENILISE